MRLVYEAWSALNPGFRFFLEILILFCFDLSRLRQELACRLF